MVFSRRVTDLFQCGKPVKTYMQEEITTQNNIYVLNAGKMKLNGIDYCLVKIRR